jgi:S-(hydroxymethyl)glutathione dehydrogenase/alcohol dehydrogenase
MKVDEYVTHRRTLGEINDGFHDMHVRLSLFAALPVRSLSMQGGDCIRCVVDMQKL